MIQGNLDNFISLSDEVRQNLLTCRLMAKYSTNLPESTFIAVCNALAQCQKLEELNLCNIFGNLEPSRLQKFCDVITQCQNLRRLDVSFNQLNQLDLPRFQVLCNAIAQCQNLQYLNLADNNLDSLELPHREALYNALTRCPHLVEFKSDIKNTDFNNKIGNMLKTHTADVSLPDAKESTNNNPPILPLLESKVNAPQEYYEVPSKKPIISKKV